MIRSRERRERQQTITFNFTESQELNENTVATFSQHFWKTACLEDVDIDTSQKYQNKILLVLSEGGYPATEERL